MPFARDRFVPEIESTMRSKRSLDILLWGLDPSPKNLRFLSELEQLRIYLRRAHPGVCDINLFVTTEAAALESRLSAIGIEVVRTQVSEPATELNAQFAEPEELKFPRAVATAQSIDADCIVVPEGPLLAYGPDLEDMRMCLTDGSFLLRCAEIFVRGFDLPWAFAHQTWHQTWTTFYQLAEAETFREGFNLLRAMGVSNIDKGAQEIGRSLIHNRFPNLCFTRDRLLWFDLQRSAAKRKNLRRQRFFFEISYHLNFYYLLLYGAFDHTALLVNGICNLGLDEKRVGATYSGFLRALEPVSKELHNVFTKTENTEFIEKLGYLRNYAAHRGSIAPTKVVRKPEKEPTPAEIDDHLRSIGMGWLFEGGPLAASVLEMARSNGRMDIYEKDVLFEDVVWIQAGGVQGFFDPLLATSWNFQLTMRFMREIFRECEKFLKRGVSQNAAVVPPT
jgi:hypothetical protein